LLSRIVILPTSVEPLSSFLEQPFNMARQKKAIHSFLEVYVLKNFIIGGTTFSKIALLINIKLI
jgi:hypothetical protein